MPDPEAHIAAALRALPRGRDALRTLFWETLGFDRVNLPVPHDLLPRNGPHALAEALIWAERDGVKVILCRARADSITDEMARAVAIAVRRTWREALVLLCPAAEASWDLLVGVPRKPGHPPSFRRVMRSGELSVHDHAPRRLSLLLAEEGTPFSQAMQALYRASRPIADPVSTFLFQLSPGLRERLRGTEFEAFVHRVSAAYPILTPVEERRLARRIAAGDRAASDELVLSNIRLAIWTAKRFQREPVEFEDLVQHALLGVVRAAKGFDGERSIRFSTYATPAAFRSCWAPLGHGPGVVRIPRPAVKHLRAIRAADEASHALTGRSLSPAEFSARFDPDGLARPLDVAPLERPESFERRTVKVRGEASSDFDPARIVAERLDPPTNAARVHEVMATFIPRDRDILHRRFGDPGQEAPTLELLGAHHGVSKERVRQIVLDRLDDLRRSLCNRWPDDYPRLAAHADHRRATNLSARDATTRIAPPVEAPHAVPTPPARDPIHSVTPFPRPASSPPPPVPAAVPPASPKDLALAPSDPRPLVYRFGHVPAQSPLPTPPPSPAPTIFRFGNPQPSRTQTRIPFNPPPLGIVPGTTPTAAAGT